MIKLRLYNFCLDDDYEIPELNPATIQDDLMRDENIDTHGEENLCEFCDGSGNLLFYHYKKCFKCNGTGVL